MTASHATSDRRGSSRFPFREEVRYRVLSPKALGGESYGKTIDMSSGGVLFTTDGNLPYGRLIEIAVNWPARLGGVCPLQFVAEGRVVRSDGASAAIHIRKYQFKTRKSGV
jgi:hypothetical protein